MTWLIWLRQESNLSGIVMLHADDITLPRTDNNLGAIHITVFYYHLFILISFCGTPGKMGLHKISVCLTL